MHLYNIYMNRDQDIDFFNQNDDLERPIFSLRRSELSHVSSKNELPNELEEVRQSNNQNIAQNQQDHQKVLGQVDQQPDHSSSSSPVDCSIMRRNMMMHNIGNYCYSRAHHYFFDLDRFPRVLDQPTYAIDQHNLFGNTYSHQNMMIGTTQLGKIINRTHFTLPQRDYQPSSMRQSNNSAFEDIMLTQDKKIFHDTMLLMCKKALKNIQKLHRINKLPGFIQLSTTLHIQIIRSGQVSLQAKKHILQQKIIDLERSRAKGSRKWAALDEIHYHASLDRRITQRCSRVRQQYDSNNIIALIYKQECLVRQLRFAKDYQFQDILRQTMTYYNSLSPCLSLQVIQRLSQHLRSSFADHTNTTTFPILILPFKHAHIELANSIIDNTFRITNQHSTLRQMGLKWFGKDISTSRDINQQSLVQQQADLSRTSSILHKFKAHYKQNKYKQEHILLDQSVNMTNPQEQHSVLRQGRLVELKGVQFLILMMWYYLCHAVAPLVAYSLTNPQFISVFDCIRNRQVLLALAQTTSHPHIVNIPLILSKMSTFMQSHTSIDFDLSVEYRPQQGIALIWPSKLAYSRPVKKMKLNESSQ